MRKQEKVSPTAVGASSLLVIFGVLCLTVFALLSISSVLAERRLADAAVDAVTDYYEADLRAEELFARLRSGEAVPGVQETDGIYTFQIAISQRQALSVALQQEGTDWTVLRWQTVTSEEELEDALKVWQGAEKEEP